MTPTLILLRSQSLLHQRILSNGGGRFQQYRILYIVSIASSSANTFQRCWSCSSRTTRMRCLNRFFISEYFPTIGYTCRALREEKKSQSLLHQRILSNPPVWKTLILLHFHTRFPQALFSAAFTRPNFRTPCSSTTAKSCIFRCFAIFRKVALWAGHFSIHAIPFASNCLR